MADVKTDNANLESKLALRREAMRRFHADGRPLVFDACCAGGVLWARLRQEFDVKYLPADANPKRLAVRVNDSRRILDLPDAVFDVIDLDTYGEPWAMLQAACRNLVRPATVFLTIGFRRMFGFGSGVSPLVIEALGVPEMTPRPIVSDLLDWGIERIIWHYTRPHRIVWAAESTRSARARYRALRIEPAGAGKRA